MAAPDQKKRLLKAKIAVALHDKLGRVPTHEEIEQVFLRTRVRDQAVLGLQLPEKGAAAHRPAGDLLTETCSEPSCSLATPGSPPSTRPSTSSRTRSPRLAASDCSPTPPLARPPSDPVSLRRWTSPGPATPWPSGGSTSWAARCATSSTPSPRWPSAGSASSLSKSSSTTTSGGKLAFHIFGALAKFERDLTRERTHAGLTATRARGRRGGRPRALDPRTARIAQTLYHKANSIPDICRTLHISRTTLYPYTNTGPAEPT